MNSSWQSNESLVTSKVLNLPVKVNQNQEILDLSQPRKKKHITDE
jgi:hypothetical protein